MTLKKKRLVANILFYTLIAISYGFVIFLIVTKLNNGTVYIFNSRFDVVLTKSMSARNEKYLDFLEGTTQIQAYDMVVSTKVNQDDTLYLKDVVLFRNPDLDNATVMHRIVGIEEEYDTLNTYGISKKTFNANDVLEFTEYYSRITLSDVAVKQIVIEELSDHQFQKDFSFNFAGNYYDGEVVTTQIDNYYSHKITFTNTVTELAVKSAIYRADENAGYISSVTYVMQNGKSFSFDASEYVESSTGYEKHCNIRYLYEIRGDLSSTSDGKFRIDDIYSRVHTVMPKMGFVISFLTSIPGLLMFIGLGIIITISSYFWNKNFNKKHLSTDNGEIKQEETIDNNGEQKD